MRLIDADAIKYERILEPRGDGMYNHANHVYEGDIDAMPTIDAVPVEYIESEKRRLSHIIETEVKNGDMKEAERLTTIVTVMDAIISNWRYTTGPDWRAEREEE